MCLRPHTPWAVRLLLGTLAGQSLASMESHRGEPNHNTEKSRDPDDIL